MATQEMETKTSKYIKPSREQKVFEGLSVLFLFSLFVMPQYFGLALPVFDFTLLRIMIVLIAFMIIVDDQRKNDFGNLILQSKLTIVLIPYMMVISYTMVLRADINAFLNPFIEIFSLFLLIYVIQYVLGVERTMNILVKYVYLLAILGIVEYIIGRSPFSYLETIKGIYTGRFVRSGSYRIMGPCNHSLGYGLLLVASTPIACIDFKENHISLMRRPILVLLLFANVFLTGSRSTLGVFIAEIIMIFLFTKKSEKKKFIISFIVFVFALAAFLAVGYKTKIAQYILLQIANMIDTVFGTEYSLMFGGNTDALSSSSNYRAQLKYIFTVSWLNPILGIGRKRSFSSEINGSYIESIDNFYIAEYVRYAYPGLIAYAFFLIYYLIGMIKRSISEADAVYKAVFVGTVFYLINLNWVDSLQTLKYMYIWVAIFICMERNRQTHPQEVTFKSKYIKARKFY
jgi:hypothetical protein